MYNDTLNCEDFVTIRSRRVKLRPHSRKKEKYTHIHHKHDPYWQIVSHIYFTKGQVCDIGNTKIYKTVNATKVQVARYNRVNKKTKHQVLQTRGSLNLTTHRKSVQCTDEVYQSSYAGNLDSDGSIISKRRYAIPAFPSNSENGRSPPCIAPSAINSSAFSRRKHAKAFAR